MVDEKAVGRVVLAGQRVNDANARLTDQIVIGPGLRKVGGEVRVTKCGVLRQQEVENRPAVYWVDALGKRYTPAVGDFVVSIVAKKLGKLT
ncbi:Exosome component 3 [Nesidiocoris tenuis]|uniref:Exosome component 3 n=1 Tax=Nesidiocoris tenuis TaxID=355587 RepID=A0ABN7B2K1_9HEMI|nr:Exosome component 3 [Nesidiocoris tenuis]